MIPRLFICLFVMLLLPQVVFAQQLNVCERGMERCQALFEKPDFYGRCMALMCDESYAGSQSFKEMPTKEEQMAQAAVKQQAERKEYSCDNGFRRCSRLRTRQNLYWECVKDTCTDPVLKDADPTCEKGREICAPQQFELNDCMRLTCRNPSPTMDNCPRARETCAQPLNDYWDCMSDMCIGNVIEYMEKGGISAAEEQLRREEGNNLRFDMDGEPIFPQKGVHPSMRYPPKGVSAAQWRLPIPPERHLIGNPSETMACPGAILGQTNVRLRCYNRDYLSCTCSDGSRPVFKPVWQQPDYETYENNPQDMDRLIGAYQALLPPVGENATLEQRQEVVMRLVELIEKQSEEEGINTASKLRGSMLGLYDLLRARLQEQGRLPKDVQR